MPRAVAPRRSPAAGGVLVVTVDIRLGEAVGRLSALAGRPISTLMPDAVTGARWSGASIVVVGADSAVAVAERRLPRRDGVLVVAGERGPSADEPGLFQGALTIGAADVLLLPEAETRLLRCLAVGDSPERAVLLGVVGARGGAGATTLACALGVTAAREGLGVALVDADPLGAGVDLALGTEDAPGARWSQIARFGRDTEAGGLDGLLPDLGGLRVLSCDEELVTGGRPDGPRGQNAELPGAITPGALTSVLAALRRSHDLVIVDVPRQWPHAVGAGLDLLDVAVLVTPAEVRATAAAVRVLHRLRDHVDDVQLVVRGPAPGGLPADVVAGALGLPLAAELVPEPGLAEAYERGLPPGRRPGSPLATCAGRLLGALVLSGRATA